jgi:hypothetical protein
MTGKAVIAYILLSFGIALFVVWLLAIYDSKTRQFLTTRWKSVNYLVCVLTFFWITGAIFSALDDLSQNTVFRSLPSDDDESMGFFGTIITILSMTIGGLCVYALLAIQEKWGNRKKTNDS